MNKNPQCNQQNKSENEDMCIFTKTWKVAVTQHQHLKINSGFNAKKNPKQQYL